MDIHVVSNTIRLNHMASSHASCFNKQTWVGATIETNGVFDLPVNFVTSGYLIIFIKLVFI